MWKLRVEILPKRKHKVWNPSIRNRQLRAKYRCVNSNVFDFRGPKVFYRVPLRLKPQLNRGSKVKLKSY